METKTNTIDDILSIDEKDLQDVCSRYEQYQTAVLPLELFQQIKQILSYYCIFVTFLHRYKGLVRQFRKAMGLTSSSEKQRSQRGLDKDEPRGDKSRKKTVKERLLQRLTDLERRLNWHKGFRKKWSRRINQIKKELLALQGKEATEVGNEENNDDNSIEQTSQELQESLAIDCEADPTFDACSENMMSDLHPIIQEKTIKAPSTDLPEGAKVIQKFSEIRRRINISRSIDIEYVEVEKIVIEKDGEKTVLNADLRAFGPPKKQIGWNFLIDLVSLTTQYGIPFNRYAKLVSSEHKRFSAAEISRYYEYVASLFLPVYLQLGHDLAKSDFFQMDDTPAQVLEVKKYMEHLKMSAETAGPSPWESYASSAEATKTCQKDAVPSFGALISQEFGFVSTKKNGQGNKISFNTTFISGRSVSAQSNSQIMFYRSHFGSAGNFLESLLEHRPKSLKSLVVQSDLLSSNFVSNLDLLKHFNITVAGCSSHARRPFALHENDDPTLCGAILFFFKDLFLLEKALDLKGRNQRKVLAVRNIGKKTDWDQILECCQLFQNKWSSKTPLGEGIRYIIRHYEALTYYTKDARVSISNNFSERMLRAEKLTSNNAYFRKSLQGRFSMDILRTVMQTAIASRVKTTEYLLWVMKADSELVRQSPEKYTPYAYSQECLN